MGCLVLVLKSVLYCSRWVLSLESESLIVVVWLVLLVESFLLQSILFVCSIPASFFWCLVSLVELLLSLE